MAILSSEGEEGRPGPSVLGKGVTVGDPGSPRGSVKPYRTWNCGEGTYNTKRDRKQYCMVNEYKLSQLLNSGRGNSGLLMALFFVTVC